jgi:hypothetical protein
VWAYNDGRVNLLALALLHVMVGVADVRGWPAGTVVCTPWSRDGLGIRAA